MIFGKPKYFHLASNYLQYNRGLLEHFLDIKQVSPEDYLRAYDYFCDNPTKYDGATIVKDLDDIFGIDLSALCHDYDYIVRLKRYRGLEWFKMKFKYDWDYGKRMEEMGKSILTAYLRVFGLIITTPIYLLWYGKL